MAILDDNGDGELKLGTVELGNGEEQTETTLDGKDGRVTFHKRNKHCIHFSMLIEFVSLLTTQYENINAYFTKDSSN